MGTGDQAPKKKAQPSSPAKAPQRNAAKPQAVVAAAKTATIQDLCPEDKQKVTNLLKQVVDLGQEVHKLQAAQEDSALGHQEVNRLRQANHELALENVNMKAKIAQMLILLKAYKKKVHELSAAAAAQQRHPPTWHPPASATTTTAVAALDSSSAVTAPASRQPSSPEPATTPADSTATPAQQPAAAGVPHTSATTTTHNATAPPAQPPGSGTGQLGNPLLSIPAGAHVSITIQHTCSAPAAEQPVSSHTHDTHPLPWTAHATQPPDATHVAGEAAGQPAAQPACAAKGCDVAHLPDLSQQQPHRQLVSGSGSTGDGDGHSHAGTTGEPAPTQQPELTGGKPGLASQTSDTMHHSDDNLSLHEEPSLGEAYHSPNDHTPDRPSGPLHSSQGRLVVVPPEQLAAVSTQAVEVVEVQGGAGEEGVAGVAESPLLVTPGGVGAAAAASLMHWQLRQGLIPEDEALAGGVGRVLRYDPSIGKHGAFFFADLPPPPPPPAHPDHPGGQPRYLLPPAQHPAAGGDDDDDDGALRPAVAAGPREAGLGLAGLDADPVLAISRHQTLELLRGGAEGEAARQAAASLSTPTNLHATRLEISDPGRDELDELTDTLSELGSELTLSSFPGTPLEAVSGRGHAWQRQSGPGVWSGAAQLHEGRGQHRGEVQGGQRQYSWAAGRGKAGAAGRLGQGRGRQSGKGGWQQDDVGGAARDHVDQENVQHRHVGHVSRPGSRGGVASSTPYIIPGTGHLVMPVSSNETRTKSVESHGARGVSRTSGGVRPGHDAVASSATSRFTRPGRPGSSSGGERGGVGSRPALRPLSVLDVLGRDASGGDEPQWAGGGKGVVLRGRWSAAPDMRDQQEGVPSDEEEEEAGDEQQAGLTYDASLMDFVMEVESSLHSDGEHSGVDSHAGWRATVRAAASQPRVVQGQGSRLGGLAQHGHQLDMHAVALRAALAAVQQSQQVA